MLEHWHQDEIRRVSGPREGPCLQFLVALNFKCLP